MNSTLSPAFDGQRRRAGQLTLSASLMLLGGRALAAATPVASVAALDFTLRSMGGPNVRLQEQRGKVVLINFWATWCGPCRQEMPLLGKIYDKYQAAGFNLLGVNVDDDVRRATDIGLKTGVKFPLLLDTDKAVSSRYDIQTMPTTLIVDREGRVRHVHKGYFAGYEDIYEKQIRELLK